MHRVATHFYCERPYWNLMNQIRGRNKRNVTGTRPGWTPARTQSQRRSLNRSTEPTTEVATPPVHAGLSHSDHALCNAGLQPEPTSKDLEDDNEGGLTNKEDGMQGVDEDSPPSPPPLSPSLASSSPPSSLVTLSTLQSFPHYLNAFFRGIPRARPRDFS